DFLHKTELDCAPLAHAISSAVDRHRLLLSARAVSATDTLTGLMSRSEFLAMAERDRILADRLNRRLIVVVAKIPDLPRSASQRRDLALVEAGDRLRGLARPADLIGYLGDLQFGLAAFETNSESAEATYLVLREAAAVHGILLGAAIFDP